MNTTAVWMGLSALLLRRSTRMRFAACALVFAPNLATAAPEPERDQVAKEPRVDWADGEFPRATTMAELGAYAGSTSSIQPDKGGFEVGGNIEVCLICIYSNDFRVAFGDYQTLRFGINNAVLAEGLQLGYGVTRDIDVVARGYYQWYRGSPAARDGAVLGAAFRWKLVTAGVAVGVGGEAYVGARVRVMLNRFLGAHAFFDRITGEGAGVGSSTSLQLAAVLSF